MIAVDTSKTTHTHEIGIDAECPICAKLRDPVTGNPPFNEKVKAAIEEGEAMMRGDIPGKWHKPHEFDEVWKELTD